MGTQKTTRPSLGRGLVRSQKPKRFVSDPNANHTSKEDQQKPLTSITNQTDIESFLAIAQLAEREFVGERVVKIVGQASNTHVHGQSTIVKKEEDRKRMQRQMSEKKEMMRVPRRPAWTKETTKEELDKNERAAFLEWRRKLAELEETDLNVTPFERNLEIWRQLWRVIERSHALVQIVDARNPLLYRCEDLEDYVRTQEDKKNLLLINKADLLTESQRIAWSSYFRKQNIAFKFFSAKTSMNDNEAEDLRQNRSRQQDPTESNTEDDQETDDDFKTAHSLASEDIPEFIRPNTEQASSQQDEEDISEEVAKVAIVEEDNAHEILNPHQLIEYLMSSVSVENPTLGFVGYPNVGKSSTLNAILGSKKFGVSATPGKTKHFQTFALENCLLCDCPGLVFPSLVDTKAEMILAGVLPIDQLRDAEGPMDLVAERIPTVLLRRMYGLPQVAPSIDVAAPEEGEYMTGMEFAKKYAMVRGFTSNTKSGPDSSRAARLLLKDYVHGKILYCHPPPDFAEVRAFEEETHAKKMTEKESMLPSLPKEVKKQVLVRREAKALMLEPLSVGEVTLKDVKSKLNGSSYKSTKAHKKMVRGKAREWREAAGDV